MPQPVLDFVGSPGRKAVLPASGGPLAIVGVEPLHPFLAKPRLHRRTGEFVPALIEEVVVAVGARGPDYLVHGFDDVGK